MLVNVVGHHRVTPTEEPPRHVQAHGSKTSFPPDAPVSAVRDIARRQGMSLPAVEETNVIYVPGRVINFVFQSER